MPRPTKKAKKAKIEDRRVKVGTFMLGGASYRQMAEALKVSLGTIHTDAHAVIDQLMEQQFELAEQIRTLEMQRIDAMLRQVWPRAMGQAANNGDDKIPWKVQKEAIDTVLKLIQERRNWLPPQAQKLELSGPDGRPLTIDDALMMQYTRLMELKDEHE